MLIGVPNVVISSRNEGEAMFKNLSTGWKTIIVVALIGAFFIIKERHGNHGGIRMLIQ